ncbi:MAG: efflux RND transporter periplasmic adaptor subunit [Chitinophagales bacterium]
MNKVYQYTNKGLTLMMLVLVLFSCKPSPERMVKKMDRRIAKSKEKIQKFENKITGFEQAKKIYAEKALEVDNSDSKEVEKTQKQITKLEKQLADLKAGLVVEDKVVDESGKTVVTVLEAKQKDFERYIEVQGAVTSKDNVMVASNTGGVIMSILVTEGQSVGVGQAIAVVNSDVLQKNIAEVQNQLDLANTIFEKQKRLWLELNVGTEVQYLQAKNNKESLERKLETLNTQLSDATVRSTINGVVDEVFAKQGEMAGPGSPIARVVNLNNVQVEAEVPESFIGKINKGDKVEVYFASLDLTRTANIKAVSQTLNPGNRTFKIEVDLPNKDKVLKPYLLATLKLKEYENDDQLVVPTRLIQEGKQGNFVFTLKDGVVERNWLKTGNSYQGETEVLEGLEPGAQLIDLGFRNVLEGDEVKLQEEESADSN